MTYAARLSFFLMLIFSLNTSSLKAQQFVEEKVEIINGEWELVGEMIVPGSAENPPVVLLFNQAAGDRKPYKGLAAALAKEGLASLRIDLPGHGESINAGKFEPGKNRRDPMIWDAEKNIQEVINHLSKMNSIDGSKIAIVGASYSGEEAAEAGRLNGFVQAYVTISAGSFSDESIMSIDQSGAPWLIVSAREDRFLVDIVKDIREKSTKAELLVLEGKKHATDLLEQRPDLEGIIASWLKHQLAN